MKEPCVQFDCKSKQNFWGEVRGVGLYFLV